MAGGLLIYRNHFDLVGSFKMFSILMCTADLSEPCQNSLTASSCFFALNVLCFERVKRHANKKRINNRKPIKNTKVCNCVFFQFKASFKIDLTSPVLYSGSDNLKQKFERNSN